MSNPDSQTFLRELAGTFRAWRSSPENSKLKTSNLTSYIDVSDFCKSATLQEITTHGYVLTPGRFVGAEDIEDDGEGFDEKMTRLTSDLKSQFTESAKLEAAIKENLKGLGYAL